MNLNLRSLLVVATFFGILWAGLTGMAQFGTGASSQPKITCIPIPAGVYIWFHAEVVVSGVPSTGGTVSYTGSRIEFAGNSLALPDGVITFSPTATCATTKFIESTNTWITTVPVSQSGEVFLYGVAYPVTTPWPNGINPWNWGGGAAASDAGALSVSWKGDASLFRSFSTDYNALAIKPTRSGSCLDENSDPAGTPEGRNARGTPFARSRASGSPVGGVLGTAWNALSSPRAGSPDRGALGNFLSQRMPGFTRGGHRRYPIWQYLVIFVAVALGHLINWKWKGLRLPPLVHLAALFLMIWGTLTGLWLGLPFTGAIIMGMAAGLLVYAIFGYFGQAAVEFENTSGAVPALSPGHHVIEVSTSDPFYHENRAAPTQATAHAASPPEKIKSALMLGDFYRGEGKIDEAIEAYQDGLTADPANSELRARIEQLKKRQQA